jgi:hypothetical protein
MPGHALFRFLLFSTLVNYAVLIVWFLAFVNARDWMRGLHGRWFKLPDATLWVSWPKKAAKVETDIVEGTIREVALPLGFVDVKVCAVDGVWSGLKLVVRKELR